MSHEMILIFKVLLLLLIFLAFIFRWACFFIFIAFVSAFTTLFLFRLVLLVCVPVAWLWVLLLLQSLTFWKFHALRVEYGSCWTHWVKGIELAHVVRSWEHVWRKVTQVASSSAVVASMGADSSCSSGRASWTWPRTAVTHGLILSCLWMVHMVVEARIYLRSAILLAGQSKHISQIMRWDSGRDWILQIVKLSCNLINIGSRHASQPREQACLVAKLLATFVAPLVFLLLFMLLVPDSLTVLLLLL